MKRVLVKCVVFVEVELPDDADETFVIEENGCPGTGVVLPALEALIEKQHLSGVCLMCAAGSHNVVERILNPPKPHP